MFIPILAMEIYRARMDAAVAEQRTMFISKSIDIEDIDSGTGESGSHHQRNDVDSVSNGAESQTNFQFSDEQACLKKPQDNPDSANETLQQCDTFHIDKCELKSGDTANIWPYPVPFESMLSNPRLSLTKTDV